MGAITEFFQSALDAITPYQNVIVYCKYFFLALSLLMAFLLVYNIPYSDIYTSLRASREKGADKLRASMINTKFNMLNYDRISTFILSRGVVYMSNGTIDTVKYVVIKVGVAIFLAVVFMQLHPLLAIPGLVLGFLLPDFVVTQSDKGDNAKMSLDIKNIYDSLRIQTKAGVFLTESLSECYLIVKNRRLKKALLQLTNEIVAQSDIIMAVEAFNSKFNNRYIDEFCIIMKQSLESGRTVKLLEDISEQLTDMQAAINLKEKERLQRRLMLGQILVYAGILIMSIYVVGSSLINGLGSF